MGQCDKNSMDKIINKIIQSYKVSILVLFSTILYFLVFISACSTSYISADGSELTYFVKDQAWLNFAVWFLFIFLILIWKKTPFVQRFVCRIEDDDRYFNKCRKGMLIIGLAFAVFWTLTTQYRPGADQATIQKAVYMLHIKDYSLFEPGGYLAQYPHQLGLVWISYLFSLIFGSYNYIVFQLCNAIGVVVIEEKLSKIASLFGMKRSCQLAVILLSILFFPLTMYSSLIYGNIWGLACSLAAIEQEVLYFRKKKIRNIMGAVLLITLAVQLKSNYVIFMIGMIIFSGILIVKEKRIRYIAVPILMIGCYIGSFSAVKAVSEQVSGYSLDQGCSSWSWIAMGLQDGKRAPGWYNSYNMNSYKESNYQSDLQAEKSKEQIRESFHAFMDDKMWAKEFFTKKTASQWNNPTFQAFWNIQVRSSMITQPEWLWKATEVLGTHRAVGYLNLLQFIIFFGALTACIFRRNCAEQEVRLILPMIFVGGFIFHLFWEAKCQYTFSYFILLIPYAVEGVECLTEWITMFGSQKKKLNVTVVGKIILEKEFPILLYVLILANLVVILYGGTKIKPLHEDTETYMEYLNENAGIPAIEEGIIRLMSKSDLVLDCDQEGSEDVRKILLQKNLEDTAGQALEVIHHQGDTWLKFLENDLYLTVADGPNLKRRSVQAMKSNLSAGQKWKLQPSVSGGIYILYGNTYALTYDERSYSVYLAPYTGLKNQEWKFDRLKER